MDFELNPDLFYTGAHEALFVSTPDGTVDETALVFSIKLQHRYSEVLEDSGVLRNCWATSESASDMLARNPRKVT